MPLHITKACVFFQGLNPSALQKNQGEIPENEREGFWNAMQLLGVPDLQRNNFNSISHEHVCAPYLESSV